MSELVATELVGDLRVLIDGARQRVAVTVNQELALLYWRIGQRIHTDLLNEERAEYGEEIVSTVSTQLTASYGRGFGKRNLHRMLRFAAQFPEESIVATLSPQLSWSHFCELLLVKEALAREYYAEMCRIGVRELLRLHAGVGQTIPRPKYVSTDVLVRSTRYVSIKLLFRNLAAPRTLSRVARNHRVLREAEFVGKPGRPAYDSGPTGDGVTASTPADSRQVSSLYERRLRRPAGVIV